MLLYADDILERKLFKGQEGDLRVEFASREAVKLKALVGALRYLWRSSPRGLHARVTELKRCLKSDPRRSGPGAQAALGNGNDDDNDSGCEDGESEASTDDAEMGEAPLRDHPVIEDIGPVEHCEALR